MIFKILFWHSKWVGKCYFDIQNPILTYEMSRKIVFWHSKSYFDIRTELENCIFIFKILLWRSKWVGKSHSFDIQNPILTFELSRKMLYRHSISSFDIRTESENRILTFEILFWHSIWVGKCYFLNSKSYFDIRSESENRILTLKIRFWHSNWVGKCYFDIQDPNLTFELSRKILFC